MVWFKNNIIQVAVILGGMIAGQIRTEGKIETKFAVNEIRITNVENMAKATDEDRMKKRAEYEVLMREMNGKLDVLMYLLKKGNRD